MEANQEAMVTVAAAVAARHLLFHYLARTAVAVEVSGARDLQLVILVTPIQVRVRVEEMV
jgi:hypothetical protein